MIFSGSKQASLGTSYKQYNSILVVTLAKEQAGSDASIGGWGGKDI